MAKTYVHLNLNRNCWSVLMRGKLQGYRQNMSLRDVEFRVRPGGHARAVKEGKRNVHAFVVGTPSRGVPAKRPVLVRYDIKSGKFIDPQGKNILRADVARFSDDGKVRAYGAVYA